MKSGSKPFKPRTAIFVRQEHGDYQLAMVQANASSATSTLYEINGPRVYAVSQTPGSLPLFSITQIRADVFVFINRALETINQLFLEELAAAALKPDSGLATGVLLPAGPPEAGKTSSGNGSRSSAAGARSSDRPAPTQQLNSVTSAGGVPDAFFAVRRKLLVSAGGLTLVGDATRLVHRLTEQTARSGLKLLVTPYAVAVLHG